MSDIAKKVIIIGASGHGSVVADIVKKSGNIVAGFLDDGDKGTEFFGYPVLGKTDDAHKYKDDAEFVIGIGDNHVRKKIADKLDVSWYTAIHPTAVIADRVKIGIGTVVMPSVVINSSALVGEHCILNTATIIEHDNCLGEFVHVSPNAILCGTVTVGAGTHIGAGAIVKNNISICEDCKIGIGAAVVKDIVEPGTYVGVPAKKLK